MKWMKWIGIALLCVGLLAVLRWLRSTEPFLATGVCPAGFTFFNDLKGDSFCCKGTVKDKQCMATDPHTFCGLSPTLPNPRTHTILPTCSTLLDTIGVTTSREQCTNALPNYVGPGTSSMSWINGGCSAAAATGDGSQFPKGRFCLNSGKKTIQDIMIYDTGFMNSQSKELTCETLKLLETTKCPPGYSLTYDKDQYIRCVVSNPNVDPSFKYCYADEILALIKDSTGKPLGLDVAKTLCISCSYIKKRWIDKDTTATCRN
jgi:hypothetical protein